MLKSVLIAIVVAAGLGLVFIRLAPSDPNRWHQPLAKLLDVPEGDFARTLTGGYVTGIKVDLPPEKALDRLDRIATSFRNTKRLAGDVDSGLVTYISRTKYIGFPDYTTVQVEPTEDGARLIIYGRLRFGRSDLGVNQGRIKGWIKLLNPLSEPGGASS
jgi:uncharacterized protein (DUF1499 family)